mgnify:CR=1 FL=1|jgi:hypothetical protein
MTQPNTPIQFFNNEQLETLSKKYRTMTVDSEGQSIEPEYNSMAVRNDIIKLISDLRESRKQYYSAETVLAIIIRNYHHVLSYDITRMALEAIGKELEHDPT